MSIHIKGMHKPESCSVCPLLSASGSYIRCNASNHMLSGYKLLSGEVDSSCPISELPPIHDGLIDRGKLFDLCHTVRFEDDEEFERAWKFIETLPAIIEEEWAK